MDTTIKGAAVVTGIYLFYGSENALKNRKKVKTWTIKARSEVLKGIKNFSEASNNTYHKVIKGVSDKYRDLKNITKEISVPVNTSKSKKMTD